MSQSTIELAPLPAPRAHLSTSSLRRPSVQPSFTSSDAAPILENIEPVVSKSRTVAIIASVSLITTISALVNGLTTVALPTIAAELSIPPGLLLWPSSIQALTCGCTLLISGSIADALGARTMYLIGSVFQTATIVGCGLSKSAFQLIFWRALSGISVSLCLPSAVSIITKSFTGKSRNIAFAFMGGGQPIGFSIGLTLGGLFTDTIGWQWGFYISAIINMAVLAVAVWGLPKYLDYPGDGIEATWKQKWASLRQDIDWVGAIVASTSLAMLSYVLAAITGTAAQIRQPVNIALLAVAIALIPVFIFWVGRQENLGRPAIIPNSLWRNQVFTTICISVFFTWGSFNALETMLTFWFQRLQHLTAIQSSLRFLPAPVSGALANVAMGLLVHRVHANWLVSISCLVTVIAPLSMAIATPGTSYWGSAFLANAFNPVGADSLFTVANLLITSVFPTKTQALAGGVFNSISQMGKSVGLAIVAVIAQSVAARTDPDPESSEALLQGYRATFWYCFGMVLLTLAITTWGLRRIGKVGHKRD